MAPSVDLIGALAAMEQKSRRAQDSARLVAALPYGAERDKFVAELNHDLSLVVAVTDDVLYQIAEVRKSQ